MYHFEPLPKEEITTHVLKEKGIAFLACDNLKDLSWFFRIELNFLKKMANKPHYKHFYIPKPGGKKRLIETPAPALKRLQKAIAFHLQGVYQHFLPDASYGFIMATADEPNVRNIYSNALRHVGKKWVLNIDLEDFFHNIKIEKVRKTFQNAPFNFSKNASLRIAQLLTFQSRLPQGAPTSPVISNIVAIQLDKKLEELAEMHGWVYTRFVDDMTFSANKKFEEIHTQTIRNIIVGEGFKINENKVRITREKDEPEITGLILKNGKPDISPQYIKGLKKDIDLFHELTSPRTLERGIFPSKLLWRFRQSLMGQINFVKFVKGEDHKTYFKLKRRLIPSNR